MSSHFLNWTMEKKIYECQFYLKDEKGRKITDYLTTYIETDNPYYVSKLLIAIYAKGDDKKIFYATPQPVKDRDALLKETLFFYYSFRFRDSKGNIGNYEYNDVIMARDWRKAEQLFLAKYAGGDSKKVWHPSSQTYRYDELYRIPSKLETYEFEFYLKDEKGNKASNMMKLSLDEVSYYKAELKLIEILADGDRNRIWHSTGKTVGLALPSLLKERKEKEDRQKQEEAERKRIERIKEAFHRFSGNKPCEEEKPKTETHYYSRPEKNTETKQEIESISKSSSLSVNKSVSNTPSITKKPANKQSSAKKKTNTVKKKAANIEEIEDTIDEPVIEVKKTQQSESLTFGQEALFLVIHFFCGTFLSSLLKLYRYSNWFEIVFAIWYALLMRYIRRKIHMNRWKLTFLSIAGLVMLAFIL